MSTMRTSVPRAFAAAGVVEGGGGIAAGPGLDDVDVGAVAQTSSCSMAAARKVSAAQRRTVRPCAARERGELAGGGGLAGAVDADHHDDFGRGRGMGVGRAYVVEDLLEFELEEVV